MLLRFEVKAKVIPTIPLKIISEKTDIQPCVSEIGDPEIQVQNVTGKMLRWQMII